jgi:hypothetical protein
LPPPARRRADARAGFPARALGAHRLFGIHLSIGTLAVASRSIVRLTGGPWDIAGVRDGRRAAMVV